MKFLNLFSCWEDFEINCNWWVVWPFFSFVAFLKHYCVTGEETLELFCTQQVQKWHRRTRKGSISMIPLKDIKVKSARMKRENKGIVISPVDPSESCLKRDVSQIVNELFKKLQKEKPIDDHIHSVVVKSEIGRNSSLGQHLIYMYMQPMHLLTISIARLSYLTA